MKIKFNDLWKFISGGVTVLTYQSWFDGYSNKSTAAKFSKEIENMNITINNISDNINKCVNNELKTKLLEYQNDLKLNLNEIKSLHEKFVKSTENITQNKEKITKLFEEYNDQFSKAFESAINKAEELDNSLNSSDTIIKNFIDNTILWEKITEFKEFLSTLSFTELCFIMNISTSIFILTCVVSLLFSFYGNFFIENLSLEKKFPRLSGFIRLRAQLQHSYIIINTILIILGLFFIIYINIITFIHS
uniref:Uncharacterized protein n=1 Tax=Hericium coralloides TaxID=100756 RepID=A0A1P8NNI2_HERCO|nr:hypothetical protein [Hericium coralloides]APX41089.1 hypothetical protein [Hericium coralloides]